mmetsp:Transcript_20984/g.45374  ORF Transcript_20984/g.45374 Transcript_20984/m.45374 type:complete len:430 (+) Transcript_20984:122-1411(+)
MEFIGTVKSYNPSKGWGFIECPETHQMYGKDIFVLSSNLPKDRETRKGDKVAFQVIQGDNGMQGASIRYLGSSDAGVVGGRQSTSQAMTPYQYPAQSMGTMGYGVSADYVGVVKSYNEGKGYGFVTSDNILRTWGKDILFNKNSLNGATVVPGQQVAFAVIQGNQGPVAQNIQIFGAAPAQTMGGGYIGGYGAGYPGAGMGAYQGGPAYGGAYSTPYMGSVTSNNSSIGYGPVSSGGMSSSGGNRASASQARTKNTKNDRYYGSVRSFNEEKGWGHIDCPAAKAMYGKDVFLLKSVINGQDITTGTLVAFGIVAGNRGPQATDVNPIPAGAFSTGDEPGTPFMGAIKSFNEEKGWGFITSEEIQKVFGKDIFLHKRELNGAAAPNVGDVMTFTVNQGNNGQLEAKNVQIGGGGYGAATEKKSANRSSPY